MMLIKGELEDLEAKEVRIFRYALLERELGPFENYKQFDGWECEEVMVRQRIEGVELIEYGWQIVGTTRIIEIQWTTPR